jgi:hypothetical protein
MKITLRTGRFPRRSCALALVLATLLLPGVASGAESPPLPDPKWRAFQTGALRADRLQHASLAFTGGLGVGIISRRPAAAFAAGAAFGLAKEFIDMGSDRFDWVDLAADLAGAGLSALATRSLTP